MYLHLDRPADRLLTKRLELVAGWIEDDQPDQSLSLLVGRRQLPLLRCVHPGVAGGWLPPAAQIARDQKGLYTGRSAANAAMVVGKDLACEYPSNPDMTIDNDGIRTPREIAATMWQEVSPRMRQTGGRL